MNKNNQNQEERFLILLEDLNGKFKAFGENMVSLMDAVGELKTDVAELKDGQERLFEKMDWVVEEIKDIKKEIGEIKGGLVKKLTWKG